MRQHDRPEQVSHGKDNGSIDRVHTRLLLYIKELLAALERWASHEASEVDVSDAFVRLGNEFNLMCRAFIAAGIDTDDLGDIPQVLRGILESVLAEEASKQNLDRFHPQINGVVSTLIRQLKHKQAIARLGVRESGVWSNNAEDQHSVSSAHSNRSAHSSQQQSRHPPNFQQQKARQPTDTVRSNAVVAHSRVRPKQKLQPAQSSGTGASASAATSTVPPVPVSHVMLPSEQVRRSTEPRKMQSGSAAPASPTIPAEARSVSDAIVNDSLARLQRSDGPMRRASRRFSAYHMSKMMTGDGTMVLPTTASHASIAAEYHASTVLDESWRHENYEPRPASPSVAAAGGRLASVPEVVSPQLNRHAGGSSPQPGKTKTQASSAGRSQALPALPGTTASPEIYNRADSLSPNLASQTSAGQPLNSVVVFLRMGKRILKARLQSPPSLAALRLQFVDSFAYTPAPGQLFPELAVQDNESGIEYELNEQSIHDVVDGTLIVLKAKSEEEAGLEQRMNSIEQMLKELINRPASTPGRATHVHPPPTMSRKWPSQGAQGHAHAPLIGGISSPTNVIQSARTEIASIRQAASKGFAAAKKEVADLTAQVLALRESSEGGGARQFMSDNIKRLEKDSSTLVALFDDLQDLVDAQRKDVASRGVRMGPKELDATRKELESAQIQLNEFTEFITREKPAWKHTWERELDTIVKEQDQLRLQEKLAADMAADMAATRETFALLEQCSAELAKSESTARKPSALVVSGVPELDVVDAREALLGEVQALRPNHEERLEAIDRAERMRRRELAMRTEEFEQELNGYVAENKLRPSGGIEALELRREKIERETRAAALKSEAEAQQRQREENERKREARKLKTALTTAATPAGSGPDA